MALPVACAPAAEAEAPPAEMPGPKTLAAGAPSARKPLSFDADAMCKAWCKRHVACGLGRCDDCPARSSRAALMRTDYRVRLTLCVQGASCESMVGTKAFRECHDFALRSIPITPALRRYCFDSARRAARCGRTDDADQSSCLIEQRHATDEALAAARACLDRPCAEVPACMAEAIP